MSSTAAIGQTGLAAQAFSKQQSDKYRNDTKQYHARERHVGPKWLHNFLHHHHSLRLFARAEDFYDDKNEALALREFDNAVAAGPPTAAERGGLWYRTWGNICQVGHGLFDTAANLTGLASFAIDLGKIATAFMEVETAGGVTPFLLDLQVLGTVVGTLSSSLNLGAVDLNSEYLSYQAVRSQDGAVKKSRVLNEMEGNNTDMLVASVSVVPNMIGLYSLTKPEQTLDAVSKLGVFLKSLGSWKSKAAGLSGMAKDAWAATRALKLRQWVAIAHNAYDVFNSIWSGINSIMGLVKDMNAFQTFASHTLHRGESFAITSEKKTKHFAHGLYEKGAGLFSKIWGKLNLSHQPLALQKSQGMNLHRKATTPSGSKTADEHTAQVNENAVASHPARHYGHSKHKAPSADFLARQTQFQGVMAAAQRANDPHPEVTAAQWALESGWGKKPSGKFNYFGIKSANGSGTSVATHEEVGGKMVSVKAKFADFSSFDAGIAAHSNFLTGKRYEKAGYAKAKTADEAITALVKGHYATDSHYHDKLMPIIRRYSGLPSSALQQSGGPDHPDVNPSFLRAELLTHGLGAFPDTRLRQTLGGHLGFDPGGARLHTGPAAAGAARALNAEAFTIGSDVFFGDGKFDPHTPKGLGLVAHELTHVGQQTGAMGDKARFFSRSGGDDMEQEAQGTAERVFANVGSPSGLLVRQYVREYEPDGEGPLSRADQERLDRISLMALHEAERMLARAGRSGGARLADLEVSVALDLEEISDGEAARVWASAIVAALSPGVVLGRASESLASRGIQRAEGANNAPWYDRWLADAKSGVEWAGGALAGNWNDEATTGQIVTDMGISLIPGVGEVTAGRDLSADIYKMLWRDEYDKAARWLSAVLNAIGLIPELGAVVKDVGRLALKGGMEAASHGLNEILKFAGRLLPHGAGSDVERLQRLIAQHWGNIAAAAAQTLETAIRGAREFVEKIPSFFAKARDQALSKIQILETTAASHVKQALAEAWKKITALFKNAEDENRLTEAGVKAEDRQVGRTPSQQPPVHVLRVQGGIMPNASRERLLLDDKGQIQIQGSQMLFFNIGQEGRAIEFLEKRGETAYVVRAEVKPEFFEYLKSQAVEERLARQYPDRPVKVDATKSSDQYGIRSDLFEKFRDSIVPQTPEKISHDDFLKRFGNKESGGTHE